MSMIPFSFMPRSMMFDNDFWHRPAHLGFGPSTLDLFDPFDELDNMHTRNLMWLNKPDFLMRPSLLSSMPRPSIPEKYRVTVDCNGFNPKSIKTDISGNKVFVSAREEDRLDTNNYSIRELKKQYELPIEAELDRLASFVTSNGQLVIEAPLRSRLGLGNDEAFPKVSEDGKSVQVSLSLPESIDPSKISVTCKDRDLIIKAEDKQEKPDRMSHFSYYRRTTLPENTDFNAIKCTMDKNQMSITAPLNQDMKLASRQIPVQSIKSF